MADRLSSSPGGPSVSAGCSPRVPDAGHSGCFTMGADMSRSASALNLPFERNDEASWYHGRPASVPRCTAHICVDNNRDPAADLVGMAVSAAYHALMAMTPSSLTARPPQSRIHSADHDGRNPRPANCGEYLARWQLLTQNSPLAVVP